MTSTPKRPRDPNQLAKFIADIATGETVDENPDEGKDPAAVLRGRLGGKVGGTSRMNGLTEEEKRKLALSGASARWAKKKEPPEGGSKSNGLVKKKS